MATSEWVNPKYAAMIGDYMPQGGSFFPATTMSADGNCTNCGGAGRTIYIDPDNGSMRDIPCQACGGSGQSQSSM